jgi:sterol desaturase/sphingolipid hydroxylase (fatty acid hydroxylase superfamily)
MNIFIGPLLLITLVTIEFLVIKFVRKEKIPWDEVTMNLNSGHILMWFFRGGELFAYYYIFTYFSFNFLSDWDLYLVLIFAFISWDFSFYWLHRLHHKIKLFWYVHEVHHQGEHFNLSLGIRNSWFSPFTSLPFFVPLALIGVSAEIFLFVSSIHYFIQFYNHTSLVKNSGFLEVFMVTPDLHKVHHAINPEYIDKNCGGTFNIWDRMFGTYQPQIKGVPLKLGLLNKYNSSNPFLMNLLPFYKVKNVNDKVNNSFKLYVASFIVFSILVVYIYMESFISLPLKVQLFSSVFLSTIAIGGMFQNKKWAIILWVFISFFYNWILVYWYNIQEVSLIVGFSTLTLYTIFLLKRKHKS